MYKSVIVAAIAGSAAAFAPLATTRVVGMYSLPLIRPLPTRLSLFFSQRRRGQARRQDMFAGHGGVIRVRWTSTLGCDPMQPAGGIRVPCAVQPPSGARFAFDFWIQGCDSF